MVLRKTGMRKEQAAQILGIDRKTLYRKEKEFGLGGETDAVSDAEPASESFTH